MSEVRVEVQGNQVTGGRAPMSRRATSETVEADSRGTNAVARRSVLRWCASRCIDHLWLGELEGLEHVPAEGPFIVAAPHASYLDFFVIGTLFDRKLRRPLRFWAKSRVMHHPFLGRFCREAGCLEVASQHSHGHLWHASLDCLLERRESICIFPEGTRSVSGEPGAFRLGYLKLALDAGVPVLPLQVVGTHALWPPSRTLPRLGRVELRFRAARVVDSNATVASLSRLNDEIRSACLGRN